MTEKVKVTKQQAEMIENHRGAFDVLMSKSLSKAPSYIKDMSTEDIACAYLTGYEVKETPEEILRKKYYGLSDYDELDRACKDSFRFVLDTLNIKIKGIN